MDRLSHPCLCCWQPCNSSHRHTQLSEDGSRMCRCISLLPVLERWPQPSFRGWRPLSPLLADLLLGSSSLQGFLRQLLSRMRRQDRHNLENRNHRSWHREELPELVLNEGLLLLQIFSTIGTTPMRQSVLLRLKQLQRLELRS